MSASKTHTIPFIDLAAQRRRLGSRVDEAIARVLSHGQFIMGPEVAELEYRLAEFTHARHVISCSSGTDALALVLMAKAVGPGQAVFCPAFTFCATAEVVAWLGATPVFVDVDEATFTMDPQSLEDAISVARGLRLNPVGLIPVDLFGQPADYDSILAIAAHHGLWTLCDAAQSFGATFAGRRVGTIGDATATSFFPSKPLGCYGDGGAIFTDNDELADVIRSLRVHGQGAAKYDNVRIGMTARLDTLQAAILLEKLSILPDEIERRNAVASRYSARLTDVTTIPCLRRGCVSTWAQYTIRVENGLRAAVAAKLKSDRIPTQIYYPKPLHLQTAYLGFPRTTEHLATSEALCSEVLSLPMCPYLGEEDQDRVVDALRRALQIERAGPASAPPSSSPN
jgi:dTDP-4-amino-4,6-dideoxygalactose transaminase